MRLAVPLLLLACGAAAGSQLRELLASAPTAEGPAACCARLAAAGFSSSLPVVVIDAPPGSLALKGVGAPISLCTCSPAGAGFADYEGLATAGVRGTTSSNFSKKSYSVELRRPDNSSLDWALLGMPADNEWILYGGDEVDLTQGMRNWAAYNLARASGRYASRTVYMEVLLHNDSRPLSLDHYAGVYIAEEKVKRGKERVAIKALQPRNLSGGYIFIFDNDNIQEGDLTFGPTKRLDFPFQLKYPSKKDVAKAPGALDWLLAYLNRFEDALFDPAWLAAKGNASYTSLIDGPSFVDYFLLTELTKNPDGYRGSTYLHKDRDGPLAMGPAWDYNEAFGLCCGYPIEGWQRGGESGPGLSGGSAISPEGWRFLICAEPERCTVEPVDGTSLWYRRLWEDPRFKAAAAARWAQLRAGNWSDAAIEGMLDGTAARIKPAVLRNYDRYEHVLARDYYANGEAEFDAEFNALRSWVLRRAAWLDGALREAAAAAANGVAGAGGAPAPAGR